MKLVALIGIGIVTVLIVFWTVGSLLPVKHRASVSRNFSVTPDRLWNLLTDYPSYPRWRRDLQSVERLEYQDGHEVWQENMDDGEGVAYVTVAAETNKWLLRKITTPGLAYGGSWRFELVNEDAGTRLTITEDGEIYNRLFRVVAKFFMGYTRSMESFLEDMQKAL